MATMITNECINCGACEPECPNNAISQGETVYVIDPQLCTECVGFHDYEACAAVCPVDCCVTDPNNIETEEALIARARSIHAETDFGDNFQSRFRKGEGQAGAPLAAAKKDRQAQVASSADKPALAAAPSAAANGFHEASVNCVQLPDVDSWEIPIRCFKCNGTHFAPVKNFMIGNVLWCPHCHKSLVIKDNLNFEIRTLLKEAYEKWDREQAEFQNRREIELAQFKERRAKEAREFEAYQARELEKIQREIDNIGDSYDAPGKPIRKGSLFGWG